MKCDAQAQVASDCWVTCEVAQHLPGNLPVHIATVGNDVYTWSNDAYTWRNR